MSSSNAAQFGTFKGVFLPSIQTILGIIMYLRMGWVVGQVGTAGAIFIITLASAITFLTALSISATATNMKVGGGGAYYMISRSFGIEAGAAIGIPLFLAQAMGVSFYIAGFSEAVHHLIPFASPAIIGTIALIGLAVLSFVSTELALRMQLGILAVMGLSLISFFLGQTPTELPAPEGPPQLVSFWTVFAVFFPAVTGIEAGIAMSGDLKNPGRSLPWGTLSAVVVGYMVYVAIAVFLGANVPTQDLLSNSMIMVAVAKFSFLVLLGIWGSSLSSALGALLGAPRTLQALASDKVIPLLNEKACHLIAYTIALAGIWMGDLNAIAPVLSMFFLTSYASLNLAAALEGFIANPSWRPSFRTPWALSAVGAVGCLAAMLMIDAGSTMVAVVLSALIYIGMSFRSMNSRWSDIRYSMMLSLARLSVYGLSRLKVDARSWRPNLLVLSGSPQGRWYMVELADAITQGKGFLTVVSILTSESEISDERLQSMERSVRDFLKKKGVPALIEISTAKDVLSGAENVIRNYGLGPLVPNTIVLGETEKEEQFEGFVRLIKNIVRLRRNLLILRDGPAPERPQQFFLRTKKRIDVWWGRDQNNAGFMLALGHLIQTSPEWKGAHLTLNSVVTRGEERDAALAHLNKFILDARIDATAAVFVSADPFETIRRESRSADLIFIGMQPPKDSADYIDYYAGLLKKTAGLPPVALTLASEDVQFREIFN